MAKDPAFLFYSKDWIEGTAELSIQAKGVYIDLLCYQHQKGDLPTDIEKIARLVRMSKEEVQPYWEEIKSKFEAKGNRMVNRKLNQVVNERFEKAKRNRIIGIYAALIKKENLSKSDYKKVKNDFKPDEFMQFDTERITERITEWFYKRLKSIEDVNANEDVNNIISIRFEKFKNECYLHESKYDQNLIDEFINYWSEKNKSKTKMRFELQPTFEISKRLSTWYNRKINNEKQRTSNQSKIENLSDGVTD